MGITAAIFFRSFSQFFLGTAMVCGEMKNTKKKASKNIIQRVGSLGHPFSEIPWTAEAPAAYRCRKKNDIADAIEVLFEKVWYIRHLIRRDKVAAGEEV